MFSTLGPGHAEGAARRRGRSRACTRFTDMHDLGDMLVAAGFTAPVMDMEMLDIAYRDPASLLDDLRASGQTSARADRPRGLAGRRFARGAARAGSRRRRLSKWFTGTRGRRRRERRTRCRKPCVFSSACLETGSPDVILSRTHVKRNCSMSPAGLAKVFAALAAVVLAIGAGFATVGRLAGAAVRGAGSAAARRGLPGVRAAIRHGRRNRPTDLFGELEHEGK